MKEMIWDLANSPAFVAIIVSGVVYLLNRLYAKKPGWARYEGTIIAAIRYAEKAIPDDAERKSLQRLDAALKYVLDVIEERERRVTSAVERAAITEAIQIIHDRIEKD